MPGRYAKHRGHAHRQRRKEVLADAEVCTWCGRPISDELPVGHPNKAVADHVDAMAAGGAPDGLMVPSCWTCNATRRAGPPPIAAASKNRSRAW